MSAVFGALRCACIVLDANFTASHVSEDLDGVLGDGAAARAAGRPVDELLGGELLGPGSLLRQALAAGERREGWCVLVRDEGGTTRLVSVSAAPLSREARGVAVAGAVYLLVLRPAEDDPAFAAGGLCAAPGLVGRSRAVARALRLVEVLQHDESAVLVTGERGTGRATLARTLHAHSPRRGDRFVAIDVAAPAPELLDRELFGHAHGAPPGAARDDAGAARAATGGSVFLDEVGDLPSDLQWKLVRLLEERTSSPIRDGTTRRASPRIIAGTSRDLQRAVLAGTFRDDLLERLRTITIALPPLRARREDIAPIASHVLARIATRRGRGLRLSAGARRALMRYGWPGNVRELEHALERAAASCRDSMLRPGDLPPELRVEPRRASKLFEQPPVRPTPALPIATDERAMLLGTLQVHRWNRGETARALGVSRCTLWRRMRAAGLC